MTIHCRSPFEKPSAFWASGSAMFTIVTSSTIINWARPMIPRMNQRLAWWGSMWSMWSVWSAGAASAV